jgi:hypothetical protein
MGGARMYLHDTHLPSGKVRKHVALPRITPYPPVSCAPQGRVSNPYFAPSYRPAPKRLIFLDLRPFRP